MLKLILDRLRDFARREPLAVVNAVAALLTAAAVEVQGDLSGDAGWVAVGWAMLFALSRQLVSPAGKAKTRL